MIPPATGFSPMPSFCHNKENRIAEYNEQATLDLPETRDYSRENPEPAIVSL